MPDIPTLYVVGSAECEVTPDEIEVSLHISTPVHPESTDALADAAGMRSRVVAAMQTHLPGVEVQDRRIGVHEETKLVERRSGHQTHESHHERRGYTGHCTVVLRAGADRAADLVAHGGAHPDVSEVHPRFLLSAGLRRSTLRRLEAEAVRDGLERAANIAAAAGAQVVEIVSVGEWRRAAPDTRGPMYPFEAAHVLVDAQMGDSGGDIADALGELRPEPQMHAARVPVRVALTAP